ncbi:MAG: hypothetical protein HGA53_00925, partial [Anaerolineaceae bacterium]|nr:hypothetical protein [Anaerolineaceae bacterium]
MVTSKPAISGFFLFAFVLNFFSVLSKRHDQRLRTFGWIFLAGIYLFQAVLLAMDTNTWPEMSLLVFISAIFLLNNRSSFPSMVLFQFEQDEKRLSSILLISFLIVTFGLKIYTLQPEAAIQTLSESSRPIAVSAMAWIGLSSISIASLVTLILSQRAKLEAIQEMLLPPIINRSDNSLTETILKQIDQLQN